MLSGLLLVWLLLVRLCPDAEILGDKSWSRSSTRLKSSLRVSYLNPNQSALIASFLKVQEQYIPNSDFMREDQPALQIT